MGISRLTFLLILLMNVSAQAWNTPTSAYKGAKYTAWTWTGAAGDNNWNNGANWCGAYLNNACQGQASAPTATSNVVFNDACTGANCNVTMPGTPVTVKNFQISDSYTGIITQGATNLTINGSFSQAGGIFNQTTGFINCSTDTSSWFFSGGTFNGGSGNITVNVPNGGNGGTFALSGGTFRSTSGTLSINVAYNPINFSSASFNANNGTVFLSTSFHTNANANITWPAVPLHHVIIDGTSSKTLTFLNDATLDGNLTLTTGGSNSALATLLGPGKLYVPGNVIHSGDFTGSASIVLTGTGLQVIDSTGCASTSTGIIGLLIQQTSVAASVRFDGNIKINGSFIANAATNLGTVNLNGALFDLSGYSTTTMTFDSDMITFPSLTISAPGPYSSFGNLTISGDLTITYNGNCSSSSFGGIIKVAGNIDSTLGSLCGATVNIELNGTGAQVLNTGGSARNMVPGIRINKTTGSVEFRNTVNGKFKIDGDFTFLTGGIALSALTMPTVTDLYVGNGGTTMTTNGYQFPASATVHFLASGSGSNIYFADDFTVLGDLKFDNNPSYPGSLTSTSGLKYVIVYGNISATSGSKGYATAGANPAWIKFTGTSHTIDYSACATSNAHLPAFENLSGGTVTVTSTSPVNLRGLKNTGTFDATGANTVLQVLTSATSTLFPGSAVFGNVTTDLSGTLNINTGETLRVNGDFTYTAQVTSRPMNGDVVVKGNIASSGTQPTNGTAKITMSGNSSTWSRTLTQPNGLITISKNAGQTVTLASSVSLSAGQSVNVTSGSLNLNAFNLTIPGTLTLAAGTTVRLNGGVLTVGGSVIPAGPYSGGTIVP